LSRIWAEVLSLEKVGVHDSFLDLGGHSLAATRVVSQVLKRFQIEVTLRSLFESPTVSQMAAIIVEHQGKKLDEKELNRILTDLEALSDAEASRLVEEA
jgi:acyl carrier protein